MGDRTTPAVGELAGRVAIVTGSTRGIGRAVAARFAAEGASIIVHGRDEAAAAAVASTIPGAVSCAGDIGAAGVVESLVSKAVDTFGQLDIVVNNAGAAIDNFITGVTPERWDASLAVNLTGPFHLLRVATGVMKPNGGGVVLNLISWSGERGNVGQVAYAAAKAGLHAVTLSAAKELGKFGIRVNSLSPAVPTDIGAGMSDQLRAEVAKRRPLKIEGTVDDVAEGALFLCSDRARFVTGETLHVDGGIHLN